MAKQTAGVCSSLALLIVVTTIIACTGPEKATSTRPIPATSTKTQALTLGNGAEEVGLSSLGIVSNGAFGNGAFGNGAFGNGAFGNGAFGNGAFGNGAFGNGAFGNGAFGNGAFGNGAWEGGNWVNGVLTDVFWTNDLWANGTAGETLRANKYLRQLLQYVYSCAMPPGMEASLDPNLNTGSLACGTGGTCDDYYSCSADNKCVIPLSGAVGLAINADSTAWWESGQCDESCQKWVSACLLARTNAYGVHVMISLRAPQSAPQRIRDTLQPTAAEIAEYPMREGAFWGNIFATTPGTLDTTSGQFMPSTPQADGTTAQIVVSTPSFNACAGPGSNVPEITKRFCSSQGDNVWIQVPGDCDAICTGIDDECTGAMHGCPSDQVLTVYLKQPIAVCGNSVCEDGEVPYQCGGVVTSAENSENCPSDCHPGGWTKDYSPNISVGVIDLFSQSEDFAYKLSAVAPDGSVVVGGISEADILGIGPMTNGYGEGFLAKYDDKGNLSWAHRAVPAVRAGGGMPYITSVAIAPVTHNITVVGWALVDYGAGFDENAFWVNTYTPEGNPFVPPTIPIHGGRSVTSTDIKHMPRARLVAVDRAANIFVAGNYAGTTTFESASDSLSFPSPVHGGFFIAKLSPEGYVLWVKIPVTTDPPAPNVYIAPYPLSLAVDPAGDVVLLRSDGQLQKLSSLDGSPLWIDDTRSSGAVHSVIAVDSKGDVYASGHMNTAGVIGAPPFLAKYRGDNGAFVTLTHANTVCPPAPAPCKPPSVGVEGVSIDFDPPGCDPGDADHCSVVYGSYGNPVVGGGIDFGAGTYPTYAKNNIFLAAYSPDLGQWRWAKHIPTILSSSLFGMGVDSQGHIVVSGNYNGSMQVDDRLLVTPDPLVEGILDTFIASFSVPSMLDQTPPEIGVSPSPVGAPLLTVPGNLYVQATSPAGTVVFFMPPTAIDSGNAGTTVACSPPPNTMFPIGTTPVTCTASDPLGHRASAIFNVTVADTLGPMITQIPAAITVLTTVPTGKVVTYATPVATDAVDGSRVVTCDPPSGSNFSIGTKKVTCTSTDSRGNTSVASFNVTVNAVDNTPPVLTLPDTITVTATSASGAVVTYTASATDAFDGPITPVCTPASGSTFALGTTRVDCTATDAHGNQAAGSFQVKVEYGWGGFQQPINSDGSSVFKLGSTIPVKFKLAGASAGITNAVANLSLAKVSSSVTGTFVEAVSTSAATTGNQFRFDGCGQYIFNLSTKGLSTGTWLLSVDLHDGVSRTVVISLR